MSKTELHKSVYTAEFVVLLISLLIPLGWSMSGLPPSIVIACICWAISLAVLLHFFWIHTTKWHPGARWCVALSGPALLVFLSWAPIRQQYHIQHSPSTDDSLSDLSHQWYFRISEVVVDPWGPNGQTTPVRLAAFVNGQPYGYPSRSSYVNERSTVRESWPMPIGSKQYRIGFEGFVERHPYQATHLEAVDEPITFNASDFPKTNQTFILKVPFQDMGGAPVSTTVTVFFDIIDATDRDPTEDRMYLRKRVHQTNADQLLPK
jgi:hypothetical protein